MDATLGKASALAIGFLLGWGMISTLVLVIGLAFAIGYALTLLPMLKTMPFRQAARVTMVGNIASITAMEITKNSLTFIIPGFMHAALTYALFWLGLGIILPAGYAVAYPAMYWAMKREQKKAYKLTSPIYNQNQKNNNSNQDDHRSNTPFPEEQTELSSKSQVVDSLILLFF